MLFVDWFVHFTAAAVFPVADSPSDLLLCFREKRSNIPDKILKRVFVDNSGIILNISL